jgi:two-component system response regulator RegA
MRILAFFAHELAAWRTAAKEKHKFAEIEDRARDAAERADKAEAAARAQAEQSNERIRLLERQLEEATRDHKKDIALIDATKPSRDELQSATALIGANTGRTEALAEVVGDIAALQDLNVFRPPPKAAGQSGPRTTLLIVEDDAEIMRRYNNIFTKLGFNVSSVSTVDDALARIDQSPPHRMILDVRVAGRDGLDVLRKVRAEGLHTWVALLTGVADSETLEKIDRLHPEHFQEKPIDFDKLVDAIMPPGPEDVIKARNPASPPSPGSRP